MIVRRTQRAYAAVASAGVRIPLNTWSESQRVRLPPVWGEGVGAASGGMGAPTISALRSQAGLGGALGRVRPSTNHASRMRKRCDSMSDQCRGWSEVRGSSSGMGVTFFGSQVICWPEDRVTRSRGASA